jgi:Amt family ammonium transporter
MVVETAVDALWTLMGAVFVFFMQAGFALLESGTVRKKNSHNILVKNLLDACIGSIIFWLVGFGFAFGVEKDGFIGDKLFAGDYAEEVTSKEIEWCFQFAFAATAATIVSGSLAERTQLETYMVFSLLMTGFIYPVIVAWTWGTGWLAGEGYYDFAGAGIVHLTGGVAGLAGAIIVGPRRGRSRRA